MSAKDQVQYSAVVVRTEGMLKRTGSIFSGCSVLLNLAVDQAEVKDYYMCRDLLLRGGDRTMVEYLRDVRKSRPSCEQ